jgi:PRTRC genetic system protein C
MKTTVIPRKFIFDNDGEETVLPDPNPAFTPHEVMSFYSHEHPELTSATVIGPVIDGENIKYEFKSVLGTKG